MTNFFTVHFLPFRCTIKTGPCAVFSRPRPRNGNQSKPGVSAAYLVHGSRNSPASPPAAMCLSRALPSTAASGRASSGRASSWSGVWRPKPSASGFGGRRTSDRESELCRWRQSEGFVVRLDDGQHRVCLVTGTAAARLPLVCGALPHTPFL